jgi:hypothetical protein
MLGNNEKTTKKPNLNERRYILSRMNRLKDLSKMLPMTSGNSSEIRDALFRIQVALGRIENRQLMNTRHDSILDYEFTVFSQWGEDGIIQFLIRNTDIRKKIFVEFGVENYFESNTRFLLVNNNWSGLVIDSNEKNVQYIKEDPIYWKYNLKAVCEFVRSENINKILSDNGINGDIGLLSIDVDGNDYWIWDAIDTVTPAIVVIEYNHRFGPERAVTIPYDRNFNREKAHHSNIYYGASLPALRLLGIRKGYAFVGCNTGGNNAFFVRKDLRPDCIKEVEAGEGFVAGQFRESRDENGQLLYLSAKEEEEILSSLPLVEVK